MRIMRWPFISLMLLAVSVLLSPEAKAEASSAGSVDYQKYCAECHNANLKGGGHGVALTGERFRTRWGKGGVPPLATFIRSMMSMNVPANAPPSVVNGIAAFLLVAEPRAFAAALESSECIRSEASVHGAGRSAVAGH